MNEMVTDFLKKSQENLKVAQLSFEHECYNACANRLYYAALQAAVAAIAAQGIQQDKVEHKQVQSDFNGRLIYRQKRYPSKFRSYLADMQLLRNEADYTPTGIGKKRVSALLAKAQEFVAYIAKEVAST